MSEKNNSEFWINKQELLDVIKRKLNETKFETPFNQGKHCGFIEIRLALESIGYIKGEKNL